MTARRNGEHLLYSDTEIRDKLMAMERKLAKKEVKPTWWEGNFIDGLCRRNRDVIMTVAQKRAAFEILKKYK